VLLLPSLEFQSILLVIVEFSSFYMSNYEESVVYPDQYFTDEKDMGSATSEQAEDEKEYEEGDGVEFGEEFKEDDENKMDQNTIRNLIESMENEVALQSRYLQALWSSMRECKLNFKSCWNIEGYRCSIHDPKEHDSSPPLLDLTLSNNSSDTSISFELSTRSYLHSELLNDGRMYTELDHPDFPQLEVRKKMSKAVQQFVRRYMKGKNRCREHPFVRQIIRDMVLILGKEGMQFDENESMFLHPTGKLRLDVIPSFEFDERVGTGVMVMHATILLDEYTVRTLSFPLMRHIVYPFLDRTLLSMDIDRARAELAEPEFREICLRRNLIHPDILDIVMSFLGLDRKKSLDQIEW
jgi:hypothetical protein